MTRSQLMAAIAAVAVLPFMPATAKDRSSDIQVSSPMSGEGVRTSIVSYADLNLRNKHGVAELTSRVKTAVKLVCAPRNYTDLAQLRPTLACKHSSMDRAKADMAFAISKFAHGERTAALMPLNMEVRSR